MARMAAEGDINARAPLLGLLINEQAHAHLATVVPEDIWKISPWELGSLGALQQVKSGRNATFGARTFAHTQAYRVHAHALNSTYHGRSFIAFRV